MEPGKGVPLPQSGTRGGDEPQKEQRCIFPGASHQDQQPLTLLGAEPEASGTFPSPAALYFLRQPLAASPIMSQYSPNSSLASSGSPMHSIFSSSGPTHCSRGGRKHQGHGAAGSRRQPVPTPTTPAHCQALPSPSPGGAASGPPAPASRWASGTPSAPSLRSSGTG